MRQLQQIQSQLTTSPVPSLDPNLVAVKFLGLCSARANLRHGTAFFRYCLRGRAPNIVAHNALLAALARHARWDALLGLFNRQLSDASLPRPDEFTFTSVLKACASLPSLRDGLKLHCHVTKQGSCNYNVFLQNSLLHFYSKLGHFQTARQLFDEMAVRDVVSWNTLLSGYCSAGLAGPARAVFDAMPQRSPVTWSIMITALSRAGHVHRARVLFDEAPDRSDAACWNAMISGYVRCEMHAEAVELFRRMQREGKAEAANETTAVSVLCACAGLGAVEVGAWMEAWMRERGMGMGMEAGNALAHMYAKCGAMSQAQRVFEAMRERDAVSWSVMITGWAVNGRGAEAVACFEDMDVPANEVTMMGVLAGCAHAGLVDTGLRYLRDMERVYGVGPTVEHYGCAVDMLSRAGRLAEAQDMIEAMPVHPNVVVWGALLGGCRTHRDRPRGDTAARRILALDPAHSGAHLYLRTAANA